MINDKTGEMILVDIKTWKITKLKGKYKP